jgi:hypothetical protein
MIGLQLQHGLAVELEHEAQHTVRARVLRPHVEDHRSVRRSGRSASRFTELRGLGLAHPQHGADLAHQLACRSARCAA